MAAISFFLIQNMRTNETEVDVTLLFYINTYIFTSPSQPSNLLTN